MEDIRLKTVPYEYEGKTYQLCCDYFTIAEIIAEFGKIPDILNKRYRLKYFPSILAAMMNSYADSQGWEERFTGREIGEAIDVKHINFKLMQDVISLCIDAMYERKETDSSKN